jgi:hypothetical protein
MTASNAGSQQERPYVAGDVLKAEVDKRQAKLIRHQPGGVH